MDNECGSVTQTELARIFGVSRKWVSLLHSKGMPRDGRRYDVAACVQWYLQTLKAKDDSPEPEDMTEARRQLYLAQTDKTRLENTRLRGETILLEDARSLLFGVSSIVATQLDAVAPRIAALVVGIDDIRAIQTLLFDEHRAIRDAIADELLRIPPPGGGDHPVAEKAVSGSVGGRESHITA